MFWRAIFQKKKRVVYFDTGQTALEDEEIDELTGNLSFQKIENKLMHSVISNDKQTIEHGKLIRDSINQGLNSFTPDLIYRQLVKNYQIAENIFGQSLLKLVSGYDPSYIQRNIKIPEFRNELKSRIEKNIESLRDDGLLNKDNTISEKGIELASVVMYFEELDRLMPKGSLGERMHKKASIYGGKEGERNYRKGDRYRDIAIKSSSKIAIRRGHSALDKKDLRVYERQSKGRCYIIYALDASGSMKGVKIDACKKAGVALAYKAISEKDKVGLIVFGSEIKTFIEPTGDFSYLLKSITQIKAAKQTDIAGTLQKAAEMFPSENITKHLILITDALPNIGDEPEKKAIEEAAIARDKQVTISVVGISLNKEGKKLAEKIAEIGKGKLYVVKDAKNVDKIVLEDYYGFS